MSLLWHLKTPVAFIVFNRPEQTRRVFAEIAKAKPPILLLIGDGPRMNRVGEVEKVMLTRQLISEVNWECEVLTNFSEINLGCKRRVSSGIDWVFSRVGEAIFLEDDCLPDPTFFRFCEEMLEYYRGDRRVGMISGDNFLNKKITIYDSYYFSRYFHIWGWASWRNRWVKDYDVSMKDWPNIREKSSLSKSIGYRVSDRYWQKIFDRVYQGKIDTWDFQWTWANWKNQRVSVMPKENLICNIGFGQEATHTRRLNPLANLPTAPLEFPLQHPQNLELNDLADKITESGQYTDNLIKRILKKLLEYIKG